MSRKLTKDLIRSRLGIDNLENIKKLDLWGNNIDDISLLSEMPLLEIIFLSMNHIKDLSVFCNLKNVKELYLKDNKITDFNQIEYLRNCKKLEILDLIDNPISKQPNYRQKILEILPFLKKLDELDNKMNGLDKNSSQVYTSKPQSSFILFKKIFPKKSNKFNGKMNELNTSTNEPNNNQNNNDSNNDKTNNDKKKNLLNISFQKKKTLGTFRKIGNKKNNINLDLSVDYAKDSILDNNNEIIDPNRSTYVGDFRRNLQEMSATKNKYNKKVVGKFKKDQIKNYQSTLLTYQEFDAPIKKEENNKKLNENNKNIKNIKPNKNESIVLQSIRILLDTLNLSELKCVDEDIKKMIKDKNK